jgi:hypothetical protein
MHAFLPPTTEWHCSHEQTYPWMLFLRSNDVSDLRWCSGKAKCRAMIAAMWCAVNFADSRAAHRERVEVQVSGGERLSHQQFLNMCSSDKPVEEPKNSSSCTKSYIDVAFHTALSLLRCTTMQLSRIRSWPSYRSVWYFQTHRNLFNRYHGRRDHCLRHALSTQ